MISQQHGRVDQRRLDTNNIKNVILASLSENNKLQLLSGGVEAGAGEIWRQVTSSMTSSWDMSGGAGRVSPSYIMGLPPCTYFNNDDLVFNPVTPLATSCLVTPKVNPYITSAPSPPSTPQWPIVLTVYHISSLSSFLLCGNVITYTHLLNYH